MSSRAERSMARTRSGSELVRMYSSQSIARIPSHTISPGVPRSRTTALLAGRGWSVKRERRHRVISRHAEPAVMIAFWRGQWLDAPVPRRHGRHRLNSHPDLRFPWRRGPELNRCARFCRPLPNHSATPPKRCPVSAPKDSLREREDLLRMDRTTMEAPRRGIPAKTRGSPDSSSSSRAQHRRNATMTERGPKDRTSRHPSPATGRDQRRPYVADQRTRFGTVRPSESWARARVRRGPAKRERGPS
jgi:hypothetical protein